MDCGDGSFANSVASGDDEVAVLRRERDQAIAHARRLEHELGALRGHVKRLDLMMWRRTARRERALRWIQRARRVLHVG